MKTSGLLLIVFIVIAVVGGGLSLTGYNESLQVTTSTPVVTHTSTTTRVATSTGPSTVSIYHENVTTLWGVLEWTQRQREQDVIYLTRYMYCATEDFDFHLDKGQLHISYDATSMQTVHPANLRGAATTQLVPGEVDFWFVNEEGRNELSNITNSCTLQRSVMGIAHDFRSSGYDSTVDIPSSGTYHIVFLNPYQNSANITLNVDYISPSTVVTMTEVRTEYSTQTNTITTEFMKPTGLGMPFFAGIGLVAVAVIASVGVAMKRKGGMAPPHTTPSGARPSPPQGPQGKFCINCGAPLPSHAPYCSECGSKQ